MRAQLLRIRPNQKYLQKVLIFILFLSIGLLFLFEIAAYTPRSPRLVRRNVANVPLARTNLPTTLRPITKSLSQLENKNELSDHVLFFNRVPKAGSEMLVLLLQWLQGVNGFRHIRLPGGERRHLNHSEQEWLVEEVSRVIRREALPVSFDRHVYFVNFTEYDRQTPIYFNLVRDPVDKAISRFYYGRVTPNPLNPDIKLKRVKSTRKPKFENFEDCLRNKDPECVFTSGQHYDLTIPYFCGHHRQCMQLNDKWALARAKKNVELFYPVVGVLEELNSTLVALEMKLPLFFKGVSEIYYKELLEPHKNSNRMRPRSIEVSTRNLLRRQLKTEFEFYYWLRARLLHQVSKT